MAERARGFKADATCTKRAINSTWLVPSCGIWRTCGSCDDAALVFETVELEGFCRNKNDPATRIADDALILYLGACAISIDLRRHGE